MEAQLESEPSSWSQIRTILVKILKNDCIKVSICLLFTNLPEQFLYWYNQIKGDCEGSDFETAIALCICFISSLIFPYLVKVKLHKMSL